MLNRNTKEDPLYGGCFIFPYGISKLLTVAANSGGWDHVSVHVRVHERQQVPTWEQMEWVKRRFFKDDEIAMQLHVPVKDHININPNVLHLWRPHHAAIPLPPASYV